MIPSIDGGLTNSGSMPIDGGGGSAGPSEATGTNSIGGIRNGSINLGGGLSSWLPWVVVIVGVVMCLKKS